ncbi:MULTISPECIES: DHA2 family efflux MFS transporter permease subunit [Amycolatopsis]|uniref:DHA2 family efflux MFS transporter permease subunit n=1 Tax=Amycolatopsis tucumanensis TaxID=401106 RepID=A0ABP7JK82_9PSEU|nr:MULTISPECIES: DHA2 family efflux MFS transporter permease subunit [Amycolatopsis]MCF6427921.1 DHA2 family efflux MFS transporter permease subunit [Amycolatopsis tucumanensis]
MSSISADERLDPALVRMITAVLLGGILGILNSTMVATGTDVLAADFGASLSTIGWATTGFLLAVTVAIPFTTWAVDRFGGRRMWLSGLAVFLAGSLAAGCAWDVGSLITARVVQGLGAGILDPLVLTLLARAAGPARAGRVMGLMGVVLSLGPVLGPVAGGAVLDVLPWRWMFLLNVPLGLVAVLLALRSVPRDDGPAAVPAPLDVRGLALLGPGFAALVLALSQAAEHTAFATASVLVPLVAGVVLLLAYGGHARRAAAPLIDLRLFARGGFTASVAVMALVGLGTFANLFVLPLYYQQVHGHGVLAAGLLVAPVGLGGALSMPLAGRLSDRIGARVLVRAGAVVALLAGLAFTWMGPDAGQAWPAVAAFVMGLGLGFVGAPTMGSLYRTLPAELVPQGSSALYMLNQLGASIGVVVVTLILETAGDAMAGFHGVYWFAVGALVVVLAASPLLPGRAER